MIIVNDEQFEKLVSEGINAIPKTFQDKLDNVVFLIEEMPNYIQRKKVSLRPGWTLFGLYEGIPQIKRNSNYSNVLPDKITLFKKPLQYFAQNEDHLKQIVTNTVWHEVAHHFGSNEEEVRNAERLRGHKY